MPGLLRGVARTAVVAGTATAVSNRVSRRQADRWGRQGYYDESPGADAPGLSSSCDNVVTESGRPDSNRRRPAWEAGILPTELRPQMPAVAHVGRHDRRAEYRPSTP